MSNLNLKKLFELSDSRELDVLESDLLHYPKTIQEIFKVKLLRLRGLHKEGMQLAFQLLKGKLQLYDRYHVILELAEIYRTTGVLRENRNIFDRYLGNLKGIYEYDLDNIDLDNYYKHRVQSEFLQVYLYTLARDEISFDLLRLFEKQIFIAKKFNDSRWQCIVTIKLAEVHWVNNDYSQATKTFRQALTLAEDNDDVYSISTILVSLLELYLVYRDHSKTQNLIGRLKKLHEMHPSNQILELNYDWASAILAKSELTILGLSKASYLLSKIIYSPHIGAYHTMIAIYHLSEIFFIELRLIGNDDGINRINSLVNLLKSSTELLAQAIQYLIISKLNIILNDMETAKENIIKAYEIGSRTNDPKVSHLFSKELELFFEQREFMKLINANDYLRANAGFRTINTSRGDGPFDNESSLYFLIATDYGIHIFSHKFPNVDSVQEELIASFLSAINTFINDAFGQEGGYIEKINHESFTIIMRKYKQFFFVYVFKGENEFVHDRITRIVGKISHILDSIVKSKVVGFIESEKTAEIAKLIADEFS
ncbi:MAG: hypothetical protein INQ03_22265 [Candidatus Heimdallarchaeota archaeon]|nr:hypothetical protein [Candidatus Heimdallarchaeota archaeon]